MRGDVAGERCGDLRLWRDRVEHVQVAEVDRDEDRRLPGVAPRDEVPERPVRERRRVPQIPRSAGRAIEERRGRNHRALVVRPLRLIDAAVVVEVVEEEAVAVG